MRRDREERQIPSHPYLCLCPCLCLFWLLTSGFFFAFLLLAPDFWLLASFSRSFFWLLTPGFWLHSSLLSPLLLVYDSATFFRSEVRVWPLRMTSSSSVAEPQDSPPGSTPLGTAATLCWWSASLPAARCSTASISRTTQAFPTGLQDTPSAPCCKRRRPTSCLRS